LKPHPLYPLPLNKGKGTICFKRGFRPSLTPLLNSFSLIVVQAQALHSATSNQVSSIRQCVYA
jgi:hypothetical protein